jgi:hypothetical protein
MSREGKTWRENDRESGRCHHYLPTETAADMGRCHDDGDLFPFVRRNASSKTVLIQDTSIA